MAGPFAEWLRRRRVVLGVSQEELSRQLLYTRDTLSKLEAGTRQPSRQVATALADYFAVPADEREAFIAFARLLTWPAGSDVVLLQTDPAPWRSLRQALTNLPVAPTALLGREGDLAELAGLLRGSRSRLLTIAGPPGVGKTRLALAAAAAPTVADGFPDGSLFVPLAALTEPGQIPAAILTASGVADSSPQPPVERLLRFVAGRRLLLVLDNFEHLLEGAGLVAELLAASPWLKVLVTSREALNLRGERVYNLAPLALPDPALYAASTALDNGAMLVTRLADFAAIALYVERSADAQPSFALTATNAATVALICARLDGLPLAIELVAARSKFSAPAAQLEQLEQGLPEASGPRDLPPRQRTLRDAIGWSYALLAALEQALLRRLAVFAGGAAQEDLAYIMSVTAAAGQAAGRGAAAVELYWPSLEALVASSLLQSRLAEDGSARFWMLETIRTYAWEQLWLHDEVAATSRAHAHYFAILAEQADRGLLEPQQDRWHKRLLNEEDNLRAALRWALQSREVELALSICGSLGRYWTLHSSFAEGRSWLEQALSLWEENSAAVDPALPAHASYWCGVMAKLQGNLDSAELRFQQGLALIQPQSADARSLAARAALLVGLGQIDLTRSDLPSARAHISASLALRRALGDDSRTAMALFNLSLVALDEGDHADQAALLEEAGILWRRSGDEHNLLYVLEGQAQIAIANNELDRAEQLVWEVRRLYEQWGDKRGIALNDEYQGRISLARGQLGAAEQGLRRSMQLRVQIDARSDVVHCWYFLAQNALAAGKPDRALRLLSAAAMERERVGPPAGGVERKQMPQQVAEQARQELSELEADAAWEQGAAMSFEDVVSYALQDEEG